MKKVIIDKIEYDMKFQECRKQFFVGLEKLDIYNDISNLYKITDLLYDFVQSLSIKNIYMNKSCESSFGGYLIKNNPVDKHEISNGIGVYFNEDFTLEKYKIILSNVEKIVESSEYVRFYSNIRWYMDIICIYVKKTILEDFTNIFHWYIKDDNFEFNNLLELVMIVKNAGDGFAEILEKNIPFIDRWTILDTGSTDNTIDIIKKTLGEKVRGKLYEEPFIDFGTSRNRALELAGKFCRWKIMLDDTYYLTGKLRTCLQVMNSDQFSDSLSIFINTNNMIYASNRILKSNRNLKYLYKIHEVIQDYDNINVMVPIDLGLIKDNVNEYMTKRSHLRKEKDIEMLKMSIEEEPNNPRHIYYLAQTYVELEKYELAYKYHLERVNHHRMGFIQEKIDSCFEAARLAMFRLYKPWKDIKFLFKKCYTMDPSRGDSLFFIGLYYLQNNNIKKAFKYFKKTWELGFPIHTQYSLKPEIYFKILPEIMIDMCIQFKEFSLGNDAVNLYLKHNYEPNTAINDNIVKIISYGRIYNILNEFEKTQANDVVKYPKKPYICFHIDGNWTHWTGSDIEKKGLGGSETFVVELARNIQKTGKFDVFVFCRCSCEEIYEGVQYFDLSKFYKFIKENFVHTVIVNRFFEYIPICYDNSNVKNIIYVIHDRLPSGNVIITHPKLKHVFPLTNWHKIIIDNYFPIIKDITTPFHHGIEIKKYDNPKKRIYSPLKKFIYSSFANRGLLHLLQMWRSIRKIIPNASLDIYCDIDHEWVKNNYPDIKQLEKLLKYLLSLNIGIKYHGWVSQDILIQAWIEADIWLYPCIFEETFCRTALEAASSKTLVITNNLGGLVDVVGNRGIIIPGDASKIKWHNQVLEILKNINDIKELYKVHELVDLNYSWAVTHSWESVTKTLLEKYIFPHDLEYRNINNDSKETKELNKLSDK